MRLLFCKIKNLSREDLEKKSLIIIASDYGGRHSAGCWTAGSWFIDVLSSSLQVFFTSLSFAGRKMCGENLRQYAIYYSRNLRNRRNHSEGLRRKWLKVIKAWSPTSHDTSWCRMKRRKYEPGWMESRTIVPAAFTTGKRKTTERKREKEVFTGIFSRVFKYSLIREIIKSKKLINWERYQW